MQSEDDPREARISVQTNSSGFNNPCRFDDPFDIMNPVMVTKKHFLLKKCTWQTVKNFCTSSLLSELSEFETKSSGI